jgi:hypothetical protein
LFYRLFAQLTVQIPTNKTANPTIIVVSVLVVVPFHSPVNMPNILAQKMEAEFTIAQGIELPNSSMLATAAPKSATPTVHTPMIKV